MPSKDGRSSLEPPLQITFAPHCACSWSRIRATKASCSNSNSATRATSPSSSVSPRNLNLNERSTGESGTPSCATTSLPGSTPWQPSTSCGSEGSTSPFIIVSGSITESTAIEIMREGAHDFLFKHSLGRLGAVLEREKKEAAMRAERRRMQQQLLLADRLSSVGMLAAGVAHEIDNPLAYVLGNLEFALNRLEGLKGLRKGEFAERCYRP